MIPRSILSCALLPLMLASGSGRAQDVGSAGLFSETVEVRVVDVDVYVTDKKGLPVTDLTRDDFLLMVDGHEVDLAYFSSYQASRVPEARRSAETPPVAR